MVSHFWFHIWLEFVFLFFFFFSSIIFLPARFPTFLNISVFIVNFFLSFLLPDLLNFDHDFPGIVFFLFFSLLINRVQTFFPLPLKFLSCFEKIYIYTRELWLVFLVHLSTQCIYLSLSIHLYVSKYILKSEENTQIIPSRYKSISIYTLTSILIIHLLTYHTSHPFNQQTDRWFKIYIKLNHQVLLIKPLKMRNKLKYSCRLIYGNIQAQSDWPWARRQPAAERRRNELEGKERIILEWRYE